MTASSGVWKFVVWERINKTGKWCPYSAVVSQLLETHYRKEIQNVSLGEVDESLKIYSVNLKDMIQVSEKTGTKSSVRRHLYSSIDALCNGYTWQWCGEKDSWHSYDIEVNTFIESAYQKGLKTVALKKTFRGYNYEIDFSKMLQINKQTKRKRSIRREQVTSPYPVEQQCAESSDTDAEPEVTIIQEEGSTDGQYHYLTQEIPGTSALVEQLNNYVRSVNVESMAVPADQNSNVPIPPTRKKNSKSKKHEEFPNNHNDGVQGSVSVDPYVPPVVTHATVNGMPWYESWPPHTPSHLLKPVPGIVPLPKLYKKKAAKKKKASHENEVDVFELHTDEVIKESLSEEAANEVCIICYEALSKESSYKDDVSLVKLKLCSHIFHKACLEAMYNSGPKDTSLQCPTCKTIHGEKCGIQPPGEMIFHVLPYSLPGFPHCDTIRIIYNIPSGIQGAEHPRPGKKYTTRGFPRHCYLPDNEIGRKVLRLLVKAWKRRLIFTIGRSSTTGEENTVTWNEIHHKTEFGCNRRGHGYPDPNYFDNVLSELEAHGVKDDEIYLWYPA